MHAKIGSVDQRKGGGSCLNLYHHSKHTRLERMKKVREEETMKRKEKENRKRKKQMKDIKKGEGH